jgi:hypothetical protein
MPPLLPSIPEEDSQIDVFEETLNAAMNGSEQQWQKFLHDIRNNPFYDINTIPDQRGTNQAHDRLAKPRGGRRPVARPPALPAPGMQQQQSFPPPSFGHNNTINTNGAQQQQPSFGFGQQSQQSNVTQSFPPFAGGNNSDAGPNTSFPPPSSTFNFANEKTQYITNPFLPGAEPLPNPQKGFQGDIFRIFPGKENKEEKKRREKEGMEIPLFAPHDAPAGYKMTDEEAKARFEEGEEAPQFANHSPFHQIQQGVIDPALLQQQQQKNQEHPQQTSVFGNLPTSQSFPSNFFGGEAAATSQPQSAQPTSNFFGHIGTPQPSSVIFGQGAAAMPQAQQSETIASPNDQTMMSASPDPSPQSRPFEFLNQPNNPQPKAQGGSLFERITKPEDTSKESPASGEGGSLFDRITKPEDASKESPAPGKGGSLFDRITKPDATTTPEDSSSSAKSDYAHPFFNITTPNGSISNGQDTVNQASGSTSPAKPANNLFRGFKTPQTPQASFPAFAPTQNSSLALSAGKPSASTQAVAQKANIPSATQTTSSITQTLSSSQRTYGTCPVAPAEFTEHEKRELITGWRLKCLEAGLQGSLRKNPTEEMKGRIRMFYDYRVKAILAANGGPLDTPTAGEKRKPAVAESEEGSNSKKLKAVTPRKPLEGPDPGGKRKVADANQDDSRDLGKKPRLGYHFVHANGDDGRDLSKKSRPGEKDTDANGDNDSDLGKKSRLGEKVANANGDHGLDLGRKPTLGEGRQNQAPLVGPDPGEKRKVGDAEDDAEAPHGKKMRVESAGKTPPSSQTATMFQTLMSNKPENSNIFGDLTHEDKGAEEDNEDDEGPSSGGLFDRITKDGKGNPVRDEPPPRQFPPPKPYLLTSSITPQNTRLLPPLPSSQPDHTWKPESAIKFSPSPSKPALGGLFGAGVKTPTKPASNPVSTTPTKTPSFGFGFTPANTTSKISAPLFNTESATTAPATSPAATNGDGGSINKKSLTSAPLFNPNSATTAPATSPAATNDDGGSTKKKSLFRPGSELFSPSLGFTPTNAASKTLAPPSNTESTTTSRATSPGATTGESATESNADDEDQMPTDNQIDLTTDGPGEEDEDTVFQVKAKAMVYDPEKKTWPVKGVGPFRVLKHKESGKARMLMRQDPSGKILLNSALGKQLNYEMAQNKAVRIPIVNAEGKVEIWVIKTGLDEAAKELASLLEKHKSA